jgi:hypothetical protein
MPSVNLWPQDIEAEQNKELCGGLGIKALPTILFLGESKLQRIKYKSMVIGEISMWQSVIIYIHRTQQACENWSLDGHPPIHGYTYIEYVLVLPVVLGPSWEFCLPMSL